jgi:hypothetical protein
MGTTIRKRPGTGSKAMYYLSHEFIIKNHGDIATCVCMVFIVGLMFQVKFIFCLFNTTIIKKLIFVF